MQSRIIENSEIEEKKISSLPTRPTASSAFGGKGYTAAQMKAAFDALPLFIIERLNTLISDIKASPDESVAGEIKTGLTSQHTLAALFSDIKDGTFAAYLNVMGESLSDVIVSIKEELRALRGG